MSDGQDVFTAITDVVKRFGKSVYGLPAQKKILETQKLIGFSLLGAGYVIPLDEISEVLEVPDCTSLPRVKSWVRGVANVRGRLLPIIDFADFLGGKLAGPSRERRVLVFEVHGAYVGVIVDQVYGMKALPIDSYQPMASESPLAAFIDGKFADENQSFELFRPQRLIEHDQFMNVSV